MATKSYLYQKTIEHLLTSASSWEDANVFAQLLNNNYVFQASHSTRAEVATRVVGSPIAVTNKSLAVSPTATSLSFDALDFSAQGAPSARWVVLGYWDGTTTSSTDELLVCIDLNFGASADVVVNAPVQLASTGLVRFPYPSA